MSPIELCYVVDCVAYFFVAFSVQMGFMVISFGINHHLIFSLKKDASTWQRVVSSAVNFPIIFNLAKRTMAAQM